MKEVHCLQTGHKPYINYIIVNKRSATFNQADMMPTWIRPGWQPQRSFRALLSDQLRKTVSLWQTLTTNLKTLFKMFPQFIGFVAAIRTLKQNWFATLAVRQWQINNGVLLFSSTKEETHESYCIVHHASNCYSTARKFMDNGSIVLLEKASTANSR